MALILALALEAKPKDGGIWTGPKVARWIEQETGREKVWNQRGWDYLKKHEYSWIKTNIEKGLGENRRKTNS